MDHAASISLTALEQRLMRLILRRGLFAYVVIVTVTSVVASEVVTMAMMVIIRPSGGVIATAAAAAFFAPLMAAPFFALVSGRLLLAVASASDELQRLARTDSLTGLANRRAFEERAEELWQTRGGAVAVTAMVDIDHFKTVNDRHGHAAGDQVLIALAQHLERTVAGSTATSVIGRLGGDEFAVVALVDDATAAESLASTLRLPAVVTEPDATASIGVAVGSHPTVEEALVAADHALYEAKRAG